MERYLIEKAYKCAKSNFKKSYFSFKDLYDCLAEDEPIIKEKPIDLYIEMIQDIRFISLGKEKWALRENFSVNDINKIKSSMFGLDEYHEEDAYQYMSEIEKKELKSKFEKKEELILEPTDEEDDNIEKPNIRKLVNEEENSIEKQDLLDSKLDSDIDSSEEELLDSDDEDINDDEDDSIILDDESDEDKEDDEDELDIDESDE